MKLVSKRKRSVKGMTLIECIIAILVVGIAGTIMARTCTVVVPLMLNANHLNNKVAAEAPVAAIQNTTTLYDASAGAVAPAAEPVTFRVTSGSASYTVNAEKYDTSCMASRSNRDTGSNLNADIDFYIVQPTPATP